MNTYTLLKNKHQKEVDAFLSKYAFFAFNNEQFARGLEKLGIQEGQEGALVRLSNTGGFVLKERAPEFVAMLKRHSDEQRAALSDPEAGYTFAYNMFVYELSNHEYGFTGDAGETLDALGMTEDDIAADPVLQRALEAAEKDVIGDCY